MPLVPVVIQPLPFDIDDITVSDLTDTTVEGPGVFDQLMRANKAHLEQEFSAGRIRGPEYAQVYLGSLQQVMQTSLAFLLERQKTALAGLLAHQAYIKAQVEVFQAEVQLEILQQQALKIPAEIAVLVAQECNLRREYDVLGQQLLKLTQETALMAQKVVTERAQVSAMGVEPDSVIGRQKLLYVAQTAGFARDAENKAAKLLIDTWNVRRTTDPNTTAADGSNGLADANILRAVNALFAGIGA